MTMIIYLFHLSTIWNFLFSYLNKFGQWIGNIKTVWRNYHIKAGLVEMDLLQYGAKRSPFTCRNTVMFFLYTLTLWTQSIGIHMDKQH